MDRAGIFNSKHNSSRMAWQPTVGIYEEGRKFIDQALDAGLDGSQAEALGKEIARYVDKAYGVALSSGTAAMHLALKLAGERLYGSASGISTPEGLGRGGALYGKQVFCPDFAALESVAPVVYEGGEPVFIDCGDVDWSMDPEVLELAFRKYPEVRIVIMNHTYGFPGQAMKIKEVCHRHGALLIEDCSESLGAEVRTGEGRLGTKSESQRKLEMGQSRQGYGENGSLQVMENSALQKPDPAEILWHKAGSFGDYSVFDFGPGRIITGGTGGVLLTDDRYSAEKALYWAGGARASVPWDQHEELGYSYRMGDLAAAAARGQLIHLSENIEKKKAIYDRYACRLEGDLASMIPIGEGIRPNYWISCISVQSGIGFRETRGERDYTYVRQHGTAAPMEIIEAFEGILWKCRPLYKPLSLQPLFRNHEALTLDGCRRNYRYFYKDDYQVRCHRAKEYFEGGICLPSDADMTEEEQDKVSEVILNCFSMDGGISD